MSYMTFYIFKHIQIVFEVEKQGDRAQACSRRASYVTVERNRG